MITVEKAMKDRNTRKAIEGEVDESAVKKKAMRKKLLIAVGVIGVAYIGYTVLKKSKNGAVQSSM